MRAWQNVENQSATSALLHPHQQLLDKRYTVCLRLGEPSGFTIIRCFKKLTIEGLKGSVKVRSVSLDKASQHQQEENQKAPSLGDGTLTRDTGPR
jgi:hypothetical protein